MAVHFSLFAFMPFFILLGVALSVGVISVWVNFAARPKPRRRVQVRSAKILAFPKGMPVLRIDGAHNAGVMRYR